MLPPSHPKRRFRGTDPCRRHEAPSLPLPAMAAKTTAASARLSWIWPPCEMKAEQLYKPGNNCSEGREAGGWGRTPSNEQKEEN